MMISKIKGKTVAFKLRALATILVLLVAALTVTAFAATAASTYTVDVYENGAVTRIETSRQDAKSILAGMKIEIGESDRLDLSGFTAGQPSSIVIYRNSNITLTTVDGKTASVAFAGTVGQLLEENGVRVSADEILNYPEYTVLTDGMSVTVQKACLVTVNADGESQQLRVGFVTVGEALAQAGVEAGEDDIVEPALNSAVEDGTVITVSRVTFETRTETEKISYSSSTKKSDAFLQGTRQVTVKGSDGEKEVTYKDTYVDGELKSSVVENEKVTKEPVNEVITVGTKTVAVPASANGTKMISELSIPSDVNIVNGVPTEYKSVITGRAAAYTSDKSARTASGRAVKPGYIAVDPKQFPYGTEMWIIGTDGTVYGYAIAADTGGFVYNGSGFTIDLYMNTLSECYSWGARDVYIYVL
jgi:uncharacterized protein YabE (DUF348 family)